MHPICVSLLFREVEVSTFTFVKMPMIVITIAVIRRPLAMSLTSPLYSILLNPHKNTMKGVLTFSPFYR